MDRRQVDDVEAELREPRQHALDTCEAAERSRKELVPGAEARQQRVGVDAELDVQLAVVVPVAARRGKRLLEGDIAPRSARPSESSPVEVRLPALELPASPRPATTRCGRPRRRRCTSTGRLVDGERAAPAVVAERLERRLAPAPRAGAAVANRPRSTSWPARKIVACTTTSSPTTRLIEKRPQFTCGTTSWIWIPGGGALRARGMGTRLSQLMRLERASGFSSTPPRFRAAASTRRPIGSSTGWRRPASRGGRCSRSVRPTAIARRTTPPPRSRARRNCSPSRARVSRAADVEEFVARHPFWTGDWAAFAGKDGLADQVRFEREWNALHDYARHAAFGIFGDMPIYVAAGSADHVAHPELFQSGEVAGAPPDALAHRSALGQSALRLERASRDGLPLVDRAVPADVRARRHGAHRPLPRFRRLLGDSGAHRTAEHGRWRPAPERSSSARRGRARRAPARRGGPRRHHSGRCPAPRATSACPGWSSCSGLSAASAATRTRLPITSEQSVVYTSHARQRHRARLVRVAVETCDASAPVSRPASRRGA